MYLRHRVDRLHASRELLLTCGIGTQSTGDLLASGASAVSQHRVLIFAQYKTTLDLIEHGLFRHDMPGVSCLRLDGSVEAHQRQGLVTRFNADPSIDVLLLTTHVGGLGLNLTGADTVIFMGHDWNPQKDLQVLPYVTRHEFSDV